MTNSKYLINMAYEYYRASLQRLQAPFNKYEHWRKVAKVLKLSRQGFQRLEWIIFYKTKAENNVCLTARHFGISRKTFYKWYNRFQDGQNIPGLEDEDKAPRNTRQREITGLQEQRIISLRKQYIRENKFNIAIYYQREYQEEISSWKVQKVIEKYNLYYHPQKTAQIRRKKQRAIKKKRITELRKKKRSGFLIQVDTIVVWKNGLKRYIITAIDVFFQDCLCQILQNPFLLQCC